MDYEQSHIHRWLVDRDCISTECLEDRLEIPKSTLRHFLKERRLIPNKYLPRIISELRKYGYVAMGDE